MVVRKRDWPKYNASQVHEPANVLLLLHELCAGVDDPGYAFGMTLSHFQCQPKLEKLGFWKCPASTWFGVRPHSELCGLKPL